MNTDTTMHNIVSLAALPAGAISDSARQMARFSLFDWIVAGRTGTDEPASRIVRDMVTEEAGKPIAAVFGGSVRVPPRAAALANGTISHALDYDDTHFAHVGHPSVGIYPAALAVGEAVGAPASDIVDAFLLGAETACRVGMVLGRKHYLRGFHQTATSGAFGATVAAGRLLGLSKEEMRNALSLVATRASGLKSQFGTMGKPFNAGIAASNGVEAALLARRGLVSADDGFGGPQGFFATHSDEAPDLSAWEAMPPERFIFEDVKYKLHACCHGTHAMIEALQTARRARPIDPAAIERIDINVNPRWLDVCDIKAPRTGLEAKFSYCVLAGMVVNDISTAADDAYTEAVCVDPAVTAIAHHVFVTGDPSISDTATTGQIVLGGGETIAIAHDLADRLPVDILENGLRTKAETLLGKAAAEAIWSSVDSIDVRSAQDIGHLLNA
ncbi:MmgE/PrpD family protein [Acuticoccus sp. M5D2P5]|uniref:MmgE/PrpD family protein n=1 Tax=Acuticoccus kalidii TaxID=2910977 RepID=UPI001F2C5D34|nr:MmgE/PrpD family protein [Acuticoccus kalidii]MCF3932420.1 MmgE/PrpD family protein [Acuticoccus kalidii]